MKRILAAVLLLLLGTPVSATIVTRPYTFTPGQVIFSSQVNSNENTLYNVINGNIDHTNIGPSGIYASQVIPTSVGQATFGGAYPYTFNVSLTATGLTLNGSATTTVPLIVNGLVSQTADLQDWLVNGAKLAYITSAGGFNGTSVASTGGVAVGGALTGATTGSFSGAVAAGSLTATGLTTAGVVLNNASGALSSSAGPLPIANGGTGSATQNFVDLTTAQTVAGVKTFSTNPNVSSSTGGYAIATQNVIRGDGTNTLIIPVATSGAGVYVQNGAANANNAHFPDAGGVVVDRGNLSVNVGSVFAAAGTGAANASFQTNNSNANTAAVRFGNTNGAGHTTIIQSASAATIAGVAGTIFSISDDPTAYLLTLSAPGSLGIAGSYFSASERRLKNNIAPFTDADLLRDLRATRIVRYAYRTEHAKRPTHIGFIADDTPEDLSPKHKAFDVNAVSATSLAGVQYLLRRIDVLEARVKALEDARR